MSKPKLEQPCPTLKKYLRSMERTGPATRQLPEYTAAILFAAAIGTYWSTHKLLIAAGVFFGLMIVLASINEALTRPRRPEERVQKETYRAARRLRSVFENENPAKRVENTVLLALESCARRYFDAERQLSVLPDSVSQVRDDALAAADSAMKTAIFHADVFVRREDQPRGEFQAICADKALIASTVARIQAQETRLGSFADEAEKHGQDQSLGEHLRRALEERRIAEAELDSLHQELH